MPGISCEAGQEDGRKRTALRLALQRARRCILGTDFCRRNREVADHGLDVICRRRYEDPSRLRGDRLACKSLQPVIERGLTALEVL